MVWTVVIALLTLLPGNYIPKVFTFLDWLSPDKVVHLALFATFSMLFIEGFRRQSKWLSLSKNAVSASLLLGMVFAFFTEAMQYFVIPGRNGNIFDLLADYLGLALGYAIWRMAGRNGNKKLSTSKNNN